MTKKVIMPVLGETMETGKIVRWSKNVGDRVEKGEILLVVESDKAALDIESFQAGYLRKIIAEKESEVRIGETIALITDTIDEPLLDN